jgi:hypothetical protein
LKGQGALAVIKNEFMKDKILKQTTSHKENLLKRLRDPEVAIARSGSGFWFL